jgi:hypothetical protein
VLSPGAALTTGEDGRATIDLARETRIEVGPGSKVARGVLRESELLLAAGVMRAHLPPIGGAPRPPLFVGTASGTVEMANAGDLMIAALPSGDAWVVAFGGAVSVTRGEVETGDDEGDRRLATTRLIEGQAAVLGRQGIADPTDAPARVEAGWTAAAELLQATPALAGEARAEVARIAAARATEALGWLEAERARGDALVTEQREAAAGDDPARARELTREIVAHSQRRVRLQVLALSRWEQHLGALGFAGSEPDEAAEERAHALLGEDGGEATAP